MNILTKEFETNYNTAPFSKIKNEDYVPAFQEAIAETKKEIAAIVENQEPASFSNTIEALSFSGMQLDRISNIFFNLHSAETNDEIEKMAVQIAPMLAELSSDITLNYELFLRIKDVYDQKESLNLTPEQDTLLTKNYKDFVRNGALLTEDKKKQLREIDQEMSVLKLNFAEHVLAETNAYKLHVLKKEDLDGLPENVVEAAHELAKEEGKEGWIFTLDYPSYIPFMTYASNRELRKELAIAAGKKGFQKNENNNEEIILKIAKLRYDRAKLLGYDSHAHFKLEERMAQNPLSVKTFLNDLLAKGKPAADREFEELSAYAKELDGIEKLEKWDGSYYSEKLKQERFNLDDEKLRPYFKLENVLNGVFDIAHKLYGLTFKEVQNIDKYQKLHALVLRATYA